MSNNQISELETVSYDEALLKIYDIVESGSFDKNVKKSKVKKLPQSEEYIDKNKSLKDVATNFVVDNFFVTEQSLYCFIQYIYESFDNMLKFYRNRNKIDRRQLFFVYKGGNIMRIISNEFLSELPAVASEELSDYYKNFFKRSDADFSIYIDPNIHNHSKTHHEIGVMSYLMLVHIRDRFLKHPETFFDFMKYSNKYRKEVLLEYLPKFNEAGEINFDNLVFLKTGAHSDKGYIRRPDFFVKKSPNYEQNKSIITGNILDSNSYIVNSYNTSLDFRKDSESPRTIFTLCRSKIGFTLFKNDKHKHVEGELIDVSIPDRDDGKANHFFENISSNLTMYKLKYKDNELKFMSYSLNYLIHDLEEILFIAVKFPWDGSKYEKRINRLFYLYFVDSFINLDKGRPRIRVFRQFKNSVIASYEKGSEDANQKAQKFRNFYHKKNLQIANIVDYLIVIFDSYDDIQEGEFNDMLSVMKKNCDVILKTLGKVHEYCIQDGQLEEDDIYDSSTEELI
jgi:hypothetical protein